LVLGPPVSGVASNITVTNNELVGGTPEAISFLAVSTATISGNVSIGSTNVSGTIDLFGGNSGVMVTSNTLFNGSRAIVIDNPSAASASLRTLLSRLTSTASTAIPLPAWRLIPAGTRER